MNAVAKTEAQAFQVGFKRIEGNIRKSLPPHIPYERFERVVMMAVQKDPKLLQTDQRTLFLECQKAASDGLLLDGREAVLVRRYNKELGKEAATYQPMIQGLKKLARNSGEIASFTAELVYEGEKFFVIKGDDPHIEHECDITLADDSKIRAAYAIAVLKNGEKVREVMSIAQIEKVRNRNKYWQSGPWNTDRGEMCRKTVARRLTKSVPLSTDRDGDARFQQAAERVDAEYTIDAEHEGEIEAVAAPASKMEALASAFTVDEDGVVENVAELSPAEWLLARIDAAQFPADLDALKKDPDAAAKFKSLNAADKARVNRATEDMQRQFAPDAAAAA